MVERDNGAERLTAGIIEKARAEAEGIVTEATQKAAGIREKAADRACELRLEYEKKAAQAQDDVTERIITTCALENRKLALKEKRRVLDEAFDTALKQLCALEREKRQALLERLLTENAEGGETLRPAAADREMLQKLLISSFLRHPLRSPVVLGENIPAGGGFRLVAHGSETDCTFEALLSDYRERRESEAAKVLFE